MKGMNGKGLKDVAKNGFIKGKVEEALKRGATRFTLNPKGEITVEEVAKAASKAGLVSVNNAGEITLLIPRAG